MWPGTFMYFQIGDEQSPVRVKVTETRVLESQQKEEEDDVHLIKLGPGKKAGLRVKCYDGSVLELIKVQPATKKEMDAKSFVNGLQGKTLRWVQGPKDE